LEYPDLVPDHQKLVQIPKVGVVDFFHLVLVKTTHPIAIDQFCDVELYYLRLHRAIEFLGSKVAFELPFDPITNLLPLQLPCFELFKFFKKIQNWLGLFVAAFALPEDEVSVIFPFCFTL
jgi:hypothetical protein